MISRMESERHMDRYTYYEGSIAVISIKEEWDNEKRNYYVQSALNRLAKYEDTGLTPEQIIDMNEKRRKRSNV